MIAKQKVVAVSNIFLAVSNVRARQSEVSCFPSLEYFPLPFLFFQLSCNKNNNFFTTTSYVMLRVQCTLTLLSSTVDVLNDCHDRLKSIRLNSRKYRVLSHNLR